MIIGQEIVHDIRGLGRIVFLDEIFVKIEFENGKMGTFTHDNEFLAYVNGVRVSIPSVIISQKKEKITSREQARQLSKYCTDFEGHQDVFGGKWNVDKNSVVLEAFEKQASSWVLLIGCGPESFGRVCEELRSYGLDNPSDYVRLYEKGHAEKYDLLVPDPQIGNVDFDLGLFFGYYRLRSTGRYQIGRKEFALRNLLKVRILEVDEQVPAED